MADGGTINLLGVSGSLRKGSYNTALLRYIGDQLLPDGIEIETAFLHDIPLYDEDVREKGFPEPVELLRRRIREADGVLIVTPEYNYSVPGVLKNGIDWVSRPPDQPFFYKPVCIMGASPGMIGTARAQYHLRQCFVFLRALVMPAPEVMVARCNTIIDDQGRITDQATIDFIRTAIDAFKEWIEKTEAFRT